MEEQRRRTAEMSAGLGWETPRLVDAMGHASDLFFDTVSQIRMPMWSSGRVALVGDAAFAPSFMPRTPEELDAHNRPLAARVAGRQTDMPGDTSRPVHSSLMLPDYGHLLRN